MGSWVLETNTRVMQVEESQHTGKISLGLSVIVKVMLKDGTFHEVRFQPASFVGDQSAYTCCRISATDTSKTAKEKPLLSRRPRKKGQQML